MTLSAELRIRRDIFIEKYLNKIDNIEMMIEVERATRQIFSRRQMAHPCMVYSRKEMADSVREAIKQIESQREKAIAYHDQIVPMMEAIRYHIDKLELVVDDQIWTLPKYRELLFIR